LPAHDTLQPPDGQLITQSELPVHVTVEPRPTVAPASAPPEMVMLLSGPASTLQSVVPAQDEMQSAAQAATQVDPPAQVVVHPVPQVTLQLFLLLQS
jgi:hypothetical protein